MSKKKTLFVCITFLLILYHSWVFVDAIGCHIEVFSKIPSKYGDFHCYFFAAARLVQDPDTTYGSYPYAEGMLLQLPASILIVIPLLPLPMWTASLIFQLISFGAVMATSLLIIWRFKKNDVLKMIGLFIVLVQLLPPLPNVPQNYYLYQVTHEITALVSPAYYHNYYWNQTNTLILFFIVASLFLSEDVTLRFPKLGRTIKRYHVSAVLFALGSSFNMTTWVFVPIWLWYNKGHLREVLIIFVTAMVAINSVFLLHPNALSGYINLLNYVTKINPPSVYLEETHHYVWIYSIPIIVGLDLYRKKREKKNSNLGGSL